MGPYSYELFVTWFCRFLVGFSIVFLCFFGRFFGYFSGRFSVGFSVCLLFFFGRFSVVLTRSEACSPLVRASEASR